MSNIESELRKLEKLNKVGIILVISGIVSLCIGLALRMYGN